MSKVPLMKIGITFEATPDQTLMFNTVTSYEVNGDTLVLSLDDYTILTINLDKILMYSASDNIPPKVSK